MTRVAISQSNYIPWKGYFDLINSVDVFVLYDDMQYTRRDWRNRNRIQTQHGPKWLTVPVDSKGRFEQKINETRISDRSWPHKHWATIRHNYVKAPYFDEYAPIFEPLYLEEATRLELLSDVNRLFLTSLNDLLGIETTIIGSEKFALVEGKSERLLGVCQELEATTYLSGPAAKNYLDQTLFKQAGIAVQWMDYSDYPAYPQVFEPFDHYVSIIDLVFCTGRHSSSFMKSFT